MGLTLWTTATLFAFMGAEGARDRPATQRRWMLCAWAAMALAVLSKGLVGIIFAGAAVFVVIILRRDIKVLDRLHLLPGLAVFLAIAGPWFFAVSLANEEFAQFFFIHEHFARFLTRAHRRVEPFWYFLPIVAAGFLPWMFAMPAAIASAWREEAGREFQPLRIAILWAAFVVLFFSASGSKLPAYVLPAFPPLALVLGRYLQLAPERRLALWSGLAIPVAIALLALAWRLVEGRASQSPAASSSRFIHPRIAQRLVPGAESPAAFRSDRRTDNEPAPSRTFYDRLADLDRHWGRIADG